jgi:hypothetical protein
MQLKRNVRAGVIATVGIATAGLLTGCAAAPATSTPETAVTAYFKLLADKDLNGALEASSYDVVKSASEGVTIPKEVLETIDPLTDFKLENVQTGAGKAIANVTYKLGKDKVEAAIDLVDMGDGDESLWLVDEQPSKLNSDAFSDSTTMIEDQKVTGTVITVPGLYDVSITAENDYYENIDTKFALEANTETYVGETLSDKDKVYTDTFFDAVADAWAEYEPTIVDEPIQYVDGRVSDEAYDQNIESMIRVVKSPVVGEPVPDEEYGGYTVALTDGEWERFTTTKVIEPEDWFDSHEYEYGWQNQGNVITSFTFDYDSDGIVISNAEWAPDPNAD